MIDTEQVLVEFLGSIEKLEPTIDVLTKIYQLDTASADLVKKSSADLEKKALSTERITEATKQQSVVNNSAIETTKDLSNALGSVYDNLIKAGNKDVITSFLNKLNTDLKITQENSGQVFSGIRDGIKDAFSDAGGNNFDPLKLSLNQLIALSEKYNEVLRDLPANSEDFAVTAAQFNNVKARISELTKDINEYHITIGKHDEIIINGEKATASINDLKQAAELLLSDLKDLNPASDQFASSSEKLQVFQDRIQQIDDKLKGVHDNLNRDTEIKINADKAEASINDINAAIKVFNDKLNSSAPGSDAFKEAAAELDKYKQRLEQIGLTVDAQGPKQLSLRTQLYALRQELALLDSQGKANTEQFENVAIAAAKVQNEMNKTQQRIRVLASETKSLDFLTTTARAIAGGFAAADAAIGLFGSKSEEVTKTIERTQHVMELLIGLTELERIFKEKNIVTVKIEQLQRKAAAISIQLEAAAESENIVIKYAAIAAQKLLNTVVAANPYVLLALVLIAVTGALVAFTNKTDDAVKNQEILNLAAEAEIESLANIAKSLEEVSQLRIKTVQQELELSNAANGPIEKRMQLERQLAQERVLAAAKQVGFHKEEVENIDLNTKKLVTLRRELEQYVTTVSDGSISEEEQKQIDNKKKQIELLDKQVEGAKKLRIELDAANKNQEVVIVKGNTQEISQRLKDASDFASSKVELTREGSAEELRLTLDAISKEKAARLNDINNDPARAGEAAKVIADAHKATRDATLKRNVAILTDAKALDESKLLLIAKESEDELKLKIKVIEDEAKIELLNRNLTLNQRLRITNSALAQINELNKSFAIKEVNDASDLKKADAERRLAIAKKFSNEELQAKIDIIRISADKTKEAENNSNNSAELKTEKNKATESAAITAIEDLKIASAKRVFDYEVTLKNAQVSLEVSKAKELLAKNEGNITQRLAAIDLIAKAGLNAIHAEQKNNEASYKKDSITKEEYELKKVQLEQKASEEEVKIAEAAAARKRQFQDLVFSTAKGLTDIAFNNERDRIQQTSDNAIQNFEKQKDAELLNKRLTADQKHKIEEKYAKLEADIKNNAYKKQRQADLIQAVVNAAIGATKVAVEFPPPLPAFYLGEATVASTLALQLAAINSKPVPKFKDGVESINGPGTTTSDSIDAKLSYKERVVSANKNERYWETLTAIHNGNIPEDVINNFVRNYTTNNVIDLPKFPTTVVNKLVMESIQYGRDGMKFNEEIFAQKLASLHKDFKDELYQQNKSTQRQFGEMNSNLERLIKATESSRDLRRN